MTNGRTYLSWIPRLALVAATTISSCTPADDSGNRTPQMAAGNDSRRTEDQMADENRFTGRGRLLNIIAGGSFVEIDHEEIEGYMDAMTMMFPVEDPSRLDGINVEDSVRFEIDATGRILAIDKWPD